MSFNEEQCREHFKRFDRDGKGTISASELVECLKDFFKQCGEADENAAHKKAVDVAEGILKETDKNQDGEITFEEFKNELTK